MEKWTHAARELQADLDGPAEPRSPEGSVALQVQHPEAESAALLEPDPDAPALLVMLEQLRGVAASVASHRQGKTAGRLR